ncbi:metal-dependent transcriptional regulator [Haloferax elongans]|nr:metal-dependent transcriptional regulator [Haloferax elongans]
MSRYNTSEPTVRQLTTAMEDAITGIYRLQETTDDRVSTSALASALDVKPATISSMFTRLNEQELIEREKHRPVILTDAGERLALRILRHHRLLETFLVECLGYGWEEVHDECDRLEHHISPRFADALESFLASPEVDPHGDPIPNENLEIETEHERVRLETVDTNVPVAVRRILTDDRDVLDFLTDAGLEPGNPVLVDERFPIELLAVRTPTGRQQLPLSVAHIVEVAPVNEGSEVLAPLLGDSQHP